MKRLRFLPVLVTLMMAGALVGPMLPAHAATVRVVDDDGSALANNCDAAGPASTTITAALAAAAPGDTIKVCPGVYNETPVVTKSVFIYGPQSNVPADTGTRTPGGPAEATVQGDTTGTGGVGIFWVQVGNVTIAGFTVRNNPGGPGIQFQGGTSTLAAQNNIVTNNTFGIYANGNTVTVSHNRIFGNNQNNAANGNGVYSDQGLTNASIGYNSFTNQANSGILIVGPPFVGGAVGPVSIAYNTITQSISGLSFFGGGGYQVAYNTISNTTADPINGNSGIFICDTTASTIANNTLTKPNFSGIAVRDCGGAPLSGLRLNNNTVTGAGKNGLDVTTASGGNAAQASYNTLTGNAADGILYGASTNGNRVIGNTAKSNVGFDCHDLGTGNVWSSNKGTTSSPAGRCTP
jgi:parallel beta-helix repeat protein